LRSFVFNISALEPIALLDHIILSLDPLDYRTENLRGEKKYTSLPPPESLSIHEAIAEDTFHKAHSFVLHSSCPVKSHLTTNMSAHSFVGFSNHLW
jgi:hypothetical protein